MRLLRAGIFRRSLALGYFCLLCLLGIMATFGAFTYHSYQRAIEEAQSETRDVAFFLSDHAARLFEASDLVLSEAVAEIENKSWEQVEGSTDSWGQLSRLTDRFPYIDAISLMDAEGRTRLVTTAYPTPPLKTGDREYFRIHREGPGSLYVSSRIHLRATGRPGFVLSRRITDAAGAFRGVAALIVDLRYFQEFYGSLNLRRSSTITLSRNQNDVLVQHPPLGAEPISDDVVEDSKGDSLLPRIESVSKVNKMPLRVRVLIDHETVDRDWWNRSWVPLSMGLTALLALAGLTFLAFRQAWIDERTKRELEQRVQERTADLKAANAELATLFREVHHRVKNNLQVISSMLRLQAARLGESDVKAVLQQCLDRVHAMSLVHEQLYSSKELANIDLQLYLETLANQLLVSFGMTDRVSVEVAADDARVDLNSAIVLALIVNEVLSNACKYAFPDNRAGWIRIRLDLASEPAVLVISDDGQGLPPGFNWQKAEGLGLQIVRSLASKLKGQPTLERADGLTTFRLAFRRAAVIVQQPRPYQPVAAE